MRFILFFAALFLTIFGGSLFDQGSANAYAKVKSDVRILNYAQWKSKRVDEAGDLHQRVIRDYKSAKNTNINQAKLTRLYRRVGQSRINIEIAKDLNSHDYFIAYLTEHFPGDKSVLAAAVKKMSPEDLAEILVQYQSVILQSRGTKAAKVPNEYVPSTRTSAPFDFDRGALGKSGDL